MTEQEMRDEYDRALVQTFGLPLVITTPGVGYAPLPVMVQDMGTWLRQAVGKAGEAFAAFAEAWSR